LSVLSVRCLSSLALGTSVHERDNALGDEVEMCLESEMASVEDVFFNCLEIAFLTMRAIDWKDVVVFAPNDQRRRLVLSKELLPFRILLDVAAVAEEHRELDVFVSRPIE
jgi:hypothetical protein